MTSWRVVVNRRTGVRLAARARWCASFGCRLRGLMFQRALPPEEALLLVEPRESRAGASIHMFFVPFSIGVVWVNTAGRVVDTVLAEPGRPYYAPRAPARYTLEAAPAVLDSVAIGDDVDFEILAA
ncbi:MAG: DUF192 domain-containing protein [Anaerolineales bacterium]|nr:DUF192 domain-containing protein [Anaerolineales bacterium]